MKIKNQSGFSIIEGLLILVILGMIGFTGWYVWNSQQNVDKTNKQAVNSTQTKVFATVDNSKYWDCFAKTVSNKPSAVINSGDNSCTVCISGVQFNENACVKKSITIKYPKAYTPESIIGFSKLPNLSVPTIDMIAKGNHDYSYAPGSCTGGGSPPFVKVVSVSYNSKLVKLWIYPSCGDPHEELVYNDNSDWIEGIGAGAPAQYQCSFVNLYKIPYEALYAAPGATNPSCLTKDGKSSTVSY